MFKRLVSILLLIMCTVPQLFAGTSKISAGSSNEEIHTLNFSSEEDYTIAAFFTDDHYVLIAIEIDEEDKDFLCSLKKYLKNRSFELSYSLLMDDSNETYSLFSKEDKSSLAELPLFLEFSDLRI